MFGKVVLAALLAVAASDSYIQYTVTGLMAQLRTSGGHSSPGPQFLAETAHGPVGWDACQPIRISISTQNLTEQRRAAVDVAVGQLAAATGLPLRVGQQSAQVPTLAWLRTRASRDGDGPVAPVLIGFVERSQTDLLVPGAAGQARLSVHDGQVVSAAVAVDVEQVGRDRLLPVVLHELGHVVGLAHSSDRSQVMHAVVPSAAVEYGKQDLLGLARLARPCRAGN